MAIDNCNIICDLLPSYIDGICSEDSRIEIEKHIADCEHCRNEYKKMSDVDVESVITDTLEIKKLKEPFVKINTRYHIKVLSIVITILILIGIVVGSIRPGIINPDLKNDIEYNEKIYWKYITELSNTQNVSISNAFYTNENKQIKSIEIDHDSRSYFWYKYNIYMNVDFICTYTDDTSVKANGSFIGRHFIWGFVRWHNGFNVLSVTSLEE